MRYFLILLAFMFCLPSSASASERCVSYWIGSEKSGRLVTRCHDRKTNQRTRCESYRIGSKKSGRVVTRCR